MSVGLLALSLHSMLDRDAAADVVAHHQTSAETARKGRAMHAYMRQRTVRCVLR